MSFLESIVLIKTLPCLAEPGKIIVVGKPGSSLTKVIPYLATLPGIISFNPETCTLTFRCQPGFVTLNPDRVYITQVRNTEEGLELLSALRDAINATWDQHHKMKPASKKKQASNHLDIFILLPQTNCKQCGEATCLAFAVNLILHKRVLEDCSPLQQDIAFTDRRATLKAML